jgi:hypothetical protein
MQASSTSKARPSPMTGVAGSTLPDQVPVLIRLREMGRRDEPETRTPPEVPPPEEPVAETPAADSLPASKAIAEPSPSPSLGNADLAANSQPGEAETAQVEPAATPARRPRTRRETPREPRSWSHRLWQGTVAFLLVSMFVIVYFIIVGGGKNSTAGPVNDAAKGSQPSPANLQEPEISIPEPADSSEDYSGTTLSSARGNSANDEPGSEPLDSTTREFAVEREDDAKNTARAAEPKNIRPRSDTRLTNPRREDKAYPVSPAGATYPVTDPGRFRYPDDSRPSAPAESAVESNSRNSPPGPSRWDERERLGGGPAASPAGGEFQPITKMR